MLTIVSADGDTPEITLSIRVAVRLIEPGDAVAGPVAGDLDPADGNQAMQLHAGISVGDRIERQVFTDGLPAVPGVGFLLMYGRKFPR